jgi:hypothetical protein
MIKNARMAYDNAVRFASRTPMSHIEKRQFANELNFLRLHLAAFGEVGFEPQVNLWRENALAPAKALSKNRAAMSFPPGTTRLDSFACLKLRVVTRAPLGVQ